jgi:hypothetical protein
MCSVAYLTKRLRHRAKRYSRFVLCQKLQETVRCRWTHSRCRSGARRVGCLEVNSFALSDFVGTSFAQAKKHTGFCVFVFQLSVFVMKQDAFQQKLFAKPLKIKAMMF